MRPSRHSLSGWGISIEGSSCEKKAEHRVGLELLGLIKLEHMHTLLLGPKLGHLIQVELKEWIYGKKSGSNHNSLKRMKNQFLK